MAKDAAPYEAAMLIEAFCRKQGIRDADLGKVWFKKSWLYSKP
jgi:hypothetical protein